MTFNNQKKYCDYVNNKSVKNYIKLPKETRLKYLCHAWYNIMKINIDHQSDS